MSTEKVMTPEEAREWMETREWANGWNVNPDATIDAVEFATQYHRNKPLWDKLFKFLAEHDPMTLEPGKIELEKAAYGLMFRKNTLRNRLRKHALKTTASTSISSTLSSAMNSMASPTLTK